MLMTLCRQVFPQISALARRRRRVGAVVSAVVYANSCTCIVNITCIMIIGCVIHNIVDDSMRVDFYNHTESAFYISVHVMENM